MPALVDDDVLALFVARADEPEALAAAVRERVGGVADRVCMVADSADPATLAPACEALRA
jgi:fructoselysine-6-P-deglycase FrlB-like protein